MSHELTIQEGQDKFIACLSQSIKIMCSRLKEPNGSISYENAKLVVADVQQAFLRAIGTVPGNIQTACNLALAPVAPSAQERAKLIKDAISTLSGVAGIAAMIAGIGLALGWGTGVIAAVVSWFTGAALLGPIAWGAVGVSLTVLAGYFVFKDSSVKFDAFENSLINGISPVIRDIWEQYGDGLLTVVTK